MSFTRDLVSNGDCGDSEMNPIKHVLTSVFEGKQNTNALQQGASTTTQSTSQGSTTNPTVDVTQLSDVQKQKIRDRATMMARHFYFDKSDEFIKQQIQPVLQKVDISYDTTQIGQVSSSMGTIDENYNIEEEDDEGHPYQFGDIDEDSDNDDLLLHDIDYIQIFKDNFDIKRVRDRTEAYIPSVKFEENPYNKVANPAEMAKSFFEMGDLVKSIQAYEVAVAKEPQNIDYWIQLGKTQAHADDDTKAIHAYTEALKLDAKNLDVIMELGVSYTNELQKIRAFAFLREWLLVHPKYHDIVKNHPSSRDFLEEDGSNMKIKDQLKQLNRYKSFDRDVVEMFEEASKRAGENDSELLGVLGTLHNVWENHHKAIAYYKKALEKSPNNYTLWNRLGATLANQKQYDQAHSCYQQAIKLKPNYVRVWSNLGICMMNIDDNLKSVEYFASALKMNPKNSLTWGYMAISFTNLRRPDLQELAEKHDLEQIKQLLPQLKEQYKQDGNLTKPPSS